METVALKRKHVARKFARHGTPFANYVFQFGLESKTAYDYDDVNSTWPQIAGSAERFSHQTFGSIAHYRASNFA
jgi:hypothetical protein